VRGVQLFGSPGGFVRDWSIASEARFQRSSTCW